MSLARVLYGSLMRTVRTMEQAGPRLRLRLPVEESKVQWLAGQGVPQSEFLPSDQKQTAAVINSLFPHIDNAASALGPSASDISADDLRVLIRARFREDTADASSKIDSAFSALKALAAQLELAQCSSAVTTTFDDDVSVRVEATSAFRGTTTQQGQPMFVYQYRVRISNEGTSAVRLLGRAWTIENADGSEHASVPRGSPGVVGQTPVLESGQAFEYASGTTFSQPGGSISGCFQFVRVADQAKFDVEVAPFVCRPPEGS